MVTVDQAEAEPTMAAEIATAVFMVVWFCQVQKQERATSKDLVVEPAKIFHITITSEHQQHRIDGWLRLCWL